MQCDQYREQLELMANAGLEEGDFTAARQHLSECAVCQQNFGQLKKLDLLIQQGMNSITPPPDLAEQILQRIGAGNKISISKGEWVYPLDGDENSKEYLDIDKSA